MSHRHGRWLAGRRRLVRAAADWVITTQTGSARMLERRLHVGQDTAAELMTVLEERGVVGPSRGPGLVRDVLVRAERVQEVLAADFPLEDP